MYNPNKYSFYMSQICILNTDSKLDYEAGIFLVDDIRLNKYMKLAFAALR